MHVCVSSGVETGKVENAFEIGNDKTEHDIQAWIVSKVAQELGEIPHEIDIGRPIASYGLDSMVMLELTGDLADWLGKSLPASLFWTNPAKIDTDTQPPSLDSPTIGEIAATLSRSQRAVPLR